MRKLLTILSSLVFLAMVLLPHLHLAFEEHTGESTVHASDCGAPHDQAPASEPVDAPSHDHDSCSICKLLTAPSDTPGAAPSVSSIRNPVHGISEPVQYYLSTATRTLRARAPPLMTV